MTPFDHDVDAVEAGHAEVDREEQVRVHRHLGIPEMLLTVALARVVGVDLLDRGLLGGDGRASHEADRRDLDARGGLGEQLTSDAAGLDPALPAGLLRRDDDQGEEVLADLGESLAARSSTGS